MVKNFFLLFGIGIIIYFFVKNSDTDEFRISIIKHPDLIISNFSATQIKDMKIVSLSSAKSMKRDKEFDELFNATLSSVYNGVKYNFKSNQITIKDKKIYFDKNITLKGSNNFNFKSEVLVLDKAKKIIECDGSFESSTEKGILRGTYLKYNLNSKNLFAKNIKMIYEVN